MLRPEITSAMFRRKSIRHDAEHSDRLSQPNRCGLAISVADTQLSKDVVQPPLIFRSPGLSSLTQARYQKFSVLPVIQTACEEDLSQHDAPTQLNSQSSGPSHVLNNAGNPRNRPRSILTGANSLQFDLDER